MISLNNTTREQDKELQKIDDGLEAVNVVLNELDDTITEQKQRIDDLESALVQIINSAEASLRGEEYIDDMSNALDEVVKIAREAQ